MRPTPLSRDPVSLASTGTPGTTTSGPVRTAPTVKAGQMHFSQVGDVKLVFDPNDFVLVAFNEDNTKRFIFGLSVDQVQDITTHMYTAYVDDAREPYEEPVGVIRQLFALSEEGPANLFYFKPAPSKSGDNQQAIRQLDVHMQLLSGMLPSMPRQFQCYENQVDFDTGRPSTEPRSISILKNPPNPKQPVMFDDIPVNAVR